MKRGYGDNPVVIIWFFRQVNFPFQAFQRLNKALLVSSAFNGATIVDKTREMVVFPTVICHNDLQVKAALVRREVDRFVHQLIRGGDGCKEVGNPVRREIFLPVTIRGKGETNSFMKVAEPTEVTCKNGLRHLGHGENGGIRLKSKRRPLRNVQGFRQIMRYKDALFEARLLFL